MEQKNNFDPQNERLMSLEKEAYTHTHTHTHYRIGYVMRITRTGT